MTTHIYHGDIPGGIDWGNIIAVDTEAMGLKTLRDRLCVVQLSTGDGSSHLVHFKAGDEYNAPNLRALMENREVQKIFHFARFDVAIINYYLETSVKNIYCTKIASKLARTYTDKHGLKELCRELLGIDISKQQQSSDWGSNELTNEQIKYAATDVLHLHKIAVILDEKLKREGRRDLARKTMEFIPIRATLDIMGWSEVDIFSH